MLRRTLFPLLLCLLTGVCSAAHGQDISLEQLLALHELPSDLPAARNAEADLDGWVFHPADSLLVTTEPLSWAWWPPADAPGPVPAAQLALRPNHGMLDVVLYLRHAPPFKRIERELAHRHLVPQDVTCLNCQGQRFAAATYTVALYQGKAGSYPFMVVVQQRLPAAGSAAPPAPKGRVVVP